MKTLTVLVDNGYVTCYIEERDGWVEARRIDKALHDMVGTTAIEVNADDKILPNMKQSVGTTLIKKRLTKYLVEACGISEDLIGFEMGEE